MKSWVSRLRAKKARTRMRRVERQAPGASIRFSDSPFVGVFLAFLTWFCAVLLLHGWRTPSSLNLVAGQRAPETIVASVPFESRDLALSDLRRAQASAAVPRVFEVDYSGYEVAGAAVERCFARIAQIRDQQGGRASEQVKTALVDVLDLLGIGLTAGEAMRLAPGGSEMELADLVRRHLRHVWSRGIVAESRRADLFRGLEEEDRISIRAGADAVLQRVLVGDTATCAEALEDISSRVVADEMGAGLSRVAVETLLRTWLKPNVTNLRYDVKTTDTLRSAAADTVEPVRMEVHKGDTIVRSGQKITLQILDQLRAHQNQLNRLVSPTDRVFNLVGNGLLLLVGLLVCVVLTKLVQPRLLRINARILLLFVISLITLLLSKGLLTVAHRTQWGIPVVTEFLLPLSLGPLMATVLMGSVPGLILGIWLSFAISVLAGNSFAILLTGLAATVTGAYVARDVRKRLSVFKTGLIVGLVQTLCVLGVGLLHQREPTVLLLQGAACVASGVFSAVLVLLLVPLFEASFKITTNITLLELSDLGHELLSRLAIEAPGTYHHSLVVASLSQAAATEIGVNSLLVRVGSYFHDIGKLTKPELFAENIQHTDDPHDGLSPSMSALVIISHVKEGISMALQHRLPRPLSDIIREHHGTTLVSFFYHKAKAEQVVESNGADPGKQKPPEEGSFRYPGPKPSTKESAIVSLADSVEAASRSLDKPTAARIEGLVNEVLRSKLEDDQLSSCNMTFAELRRIRQSFIFSLTNVLHGRVQYPRNEDSHPQSAAAATGR